MAGTGAFEESLALIDRGLSQIEKVFRARNLTNRIKLAAAAGL
jgi:hypothetical protein